MFIKRGKKGTDSRYWVPAIWGAVSIAETAWKGLGFAEHTEMVVSSGCEGKHGRGSKHYVGMAADIRTKDPAGAWELQDFEATEFADAIKDRLGDEYDVVMEPGHIHIELDPKAQLR